MSKYIINKSCDMCHKNEIALTEMTIGNTKHHICYDCMLDFAIDVMNFAQLNLREELDKAGIVIGTK